MKDTSWMITKAGVGRAQTVAGNSSLTFTRDIAAPSVEVVKVYKK